jgi:23S rRNA pseudouridine1911/1915/1917 synthase
MTEIDWTVGEDSAGVRLDKFLAAPDRFGSRARAAAALERGQVFVNGAEARLSAASTRIVAGDVIRGWFDRPGSARRRTVLGDARDLHILYEDDAIVVLNKPAGLLAVPLERQRPARSVYDELARYLRGRGRLRPFVVHRIDRDTSGLVVFATRADVQRQLRDQFEKHEPERVYRAVVYGHPRPPAGTWRDRLIWDPRALLQKEARARDPRGKEAASQYRIVEEFLEASLIEVRLVTGRRNQIRLQAGLRGYTLVGERRYVLRPPPHPIAFPRQALHAYQLVLRHPISGQTIRFEAPLPEDLVQLIARLRRAHA